MDSKLTIYKQYIGYYNTQLLWNNQVLLGLSQFNYPEISSENPPEIPLKKYRLGHLVEQFVFHDLKQLTSLKILATNCQIKSNKRTIGELDCLVLDENSPIHLEIIYKFYLYDESVGYSELEHWIGPNRKDSFIEKITKLKQKQFPLLHHPETQELLKELGLNILDIEQQVLFKAQLFVPYKLLNSPLRLINNDCVVGYYINYKQLETLSTCEFYIPQKLDWLTAPHSKVDWLNYEEAKLLIMEYINQHKSPLCWITSPNHHIQKIFVVWW